MLYHRPLCLRAGPQLDVYKRQDRRSSIIYKDVYAGVDMVYEAADNGVKEYIVLKEFSGKSGFTFELKLDGLHIKELSLIHI